MQVFCFLLHPGRLDSWTRRTRSDSDRTARSRVVRTSHRTLTAVRRRSYLDEADPVLRVIGPRWVPTRSHRDPGPDLDPAFLDRSRAVSTILSDGAG